MNDNFRLIALTSHFNADAFSFDTDRARGHFGLSCYPAEEMPEPQKTFNSYEIPFIFPDVTRRQNNIESYCQKIVPPQEVYSSFFFLGACDNGSFLESIKVRDAKCEYVHKVGLTDWCENPQYGERRAFEASHAHAAQNDIFSYRPQIWLQALTFASPTQIKEIELPDNPCFHVFALTLKICEKQNGYSTH